MYFAHSHSHKPFEPLVDHLCNVAKRAKQFGLTISDLMGEHAYVVGLLHDLGKYSVEFQARLKGAPQKVDHSTAGAQYLHQHGKTSLLPLFCIAGHHAGLADLVDLKARLRKQIPEYIVPSFIQIPDLPILSFKPGINGTIKQYSKDESIFPASLWTRFLFSCLVDADYLETERYYSQKRAGIRSSSNKLVELRNKLDSFLNKICNQETEVNKCRTKILEDCRKASQQSPGFFSLTVPTGGGKTLSSLSFALNHAVKYDKSRVIYVIPYTSIIEQTVNNFKQVLEETDPSVILEHHSNLVEVDESEEYDKRRMLSENWDANIVVTTSVQFYESLFSNRPSKCRKLHNIANSVIILDEAQVMRLSTIKPCLAALRELVEEYKCTIVLCTATQPAVTRIDEFKSDNELSKLGLNNVREIIDDPASLYTKMKRVNVTRRIGEQQTAQTIAQALSQTKQSLCIVNTKRCARELYAELCLQLGTEEGVYHLSTTLCGAHRSVTINEIKERLARKDTCIVVSTQLIEAGVDVDFPVVYRAMAGIDAIAQAAGRCNREGRNKSGRVVVFRYSNARSVIEDDVYDSAAEVMRNYPDILTIEAVERFFTELYYRGRDRLDGRGVQREGLNFQKINDNFIVIDDNKMSVVVDYGDCRKILQNATDSAGLQRKLQRYIVSLSTKEYENLDRSQIEVITVDDLKLELVKDYSDKLGVPI